MMMTESNRLKLINQLARKKAIDIMLDDIMNKFCYVLEESKE